jgi:hypothetical protein
MDDGISQKPDLKSVYSNPPGPIMRGLIFQVDKSNDIV